jgi:hypothetical protein
MKTDSFLYRLMSIRQRMGVLQKQRSGRLVSTSTMSSQCFFHTTPKFSPSSTRINGCSSPPRKSQDEITTGVQIRVFNLLKTINVESMPHCRDTVARDHKEIRPKFRKILGSLELGVRYMGIGSFKGGGRPAEHELRLPPTLKPDGSKAKHEV